MFKVALLAYGNIDHDEDPFELVCAPTILLAESIEELQRHFRLWVEFNDIGAGNLCMADVTDADTDEYLGYLSYNGRYWPKEKEVNNT